MNGIFGKSYDPAKQESRSRSWYRSHYSGRDSSMPEKKIATMKKNAANRKYILPVCEVCLERRTIGGLICAECRRKA